MEKIENKTVIEIVSINKLKEAVLRTGVIEPDIHENDKTPSWDGEIRLYSSRESFSKSKLVGRIPVQVKGTFVERFQKGKASFQADVNDLQNYLNDGGVVFFLIQIKGFDDYRIYYISLLPFDLRRLLDAAGAQKTKQIRLDLFPHKYRDGMLRIFYDFLENKKKQSTLLPNIHSIRDLKESNIDIERLEFSVPRIGIENREDLFGNLLSHPHYIYAKPKNLDVSFVVDKVYPEKIVIHQKGPIEVNGEVLYTRIDEVRLPNEKKLFKLGNDVTITMDASRFNIDYSFQGTLQEQLCEIKLMIAFLQKQDIRVGGHPLMNNYNLDSHGRTLKETLDRQSYLLRIDAMLKKLHVEKDLELGSLSDEEWHCLNCLVDGILDDKPVPLSIHGNGRVGKLTVGNISVFLGSKDNPNGQGIFIQDFFKSDDLVLSEEGEPPENGYKISPYVLLTIDLLKSIDNISLSQIVPTIKTIPYSEIYGERITLLVLELLKLFDERKNYDILEVIIQLIDYLQENDDSKDELYQINRLQTEKRRRNLTKEEIQYLMTMKVSGIPLQYQLAANILLESFQEAQIVYDMLEENERQMFDAYPIKNLWIK